MRATKIVGVTILLMSWPWLGSAQPLPAQQQSLAGLSSLRVEVMLIGAAASIGLTERALAEATQDRLRTAGLDVRASNDRDARGDPRLRVTAQAVNAAGGYAFLVSVQLVERVVAYRKYLELVFDGVLPTGPTDPVESLELAPAVRWEAQALGTTSLENAVTSVPNALLDYVDRFLEDYRAALRP